MSIWSRADSILLIAGMIVPGKYLGGTPISVKETKRFFSSPQVQDIPKLLVGPWATFGCGLQGGKLALSSEVLSPPFDYIVTGDAELVLANLAQQKWDFDSIKLDRVSPDFKEMEICAVRGSRVVTQHPGFLRKYIICEIETYRGCPRYITGGCSFCTEPLYGEPRQRQIDDIVREIESLYKHGVRAFRIGRQADLYTYGSHQIGELEFPTPNPEAIEELFSKIRRVAPKVNVLHIDNVNPGTVARYPEESRRITKTIVKYHTPGDVAALGAESLDPTVIKKNNLKATAEEVFEAVKILNEAGGNRSEWGLPHLLPGINLLYGLPGETTKTIEYNMNFLQELLDENLVVRRINIRQVIGFPGTRAAVKQKGGLKRNVFFKHKEDVRELIDLTMIKRVAPSGTILRSAFVEKHEGNNTLLRQLGTYPLLCHMSSGSETYEVTDVAVVDHGPRSLTVLPFPFKAASASLAQWRAIPGFGAKRAARMKSGGQLESIEDIEKRLEMQIPDWLGHIISFDAN
ncbi:MAG: radical SAM protein [Candidatus Thorarchaeota archaeon]|jgi:radical SAM superfamily enzyme with C-terminal helix-hairpin-helix motif